MFILSSCFVVFQSNPKSIAVYLSCDYYIVLTGQTKVFSINILNYASDIYLETMLYPIYIEHRTFNACTLIGFPEHKMAQYPVNPCQYPGCVFKAESTSEAIGLAMFQSNLMSHSQATAQLSYHLFDQVDGVAIPSCPYSCELIMGHHEKRWLDNVSIQSLMGIDDMWMIYFVFSTTINRQLIFTITLICNIPT